MTQSFRLDPRAVLLLVALAAVWGGSFLFAGLALREVPPLTIVLHRVGWSVPVLYLLLRLRGLRVPRGVRLWRSYLVMGLLNNAIPFSLIFWGQTQIESGLASILNGTTAVFGAVVAGLLLKDEPLTRNKVIGAALGLIGVAIIMGPQALSGFDLRNLGQLAILLAALSYALASVWGRVQLSDQPPLVNAFGMVTGSFVIMIPLVLWVDGGPHFQLQPLTWVALAGLALGSTVAGYVLYFAVLRRAGAANLMLVTLMIPPFAILFGALFLQESLSLQAVLGFGVIALGLLVTDGRLLGARAVPTR